MLQFYDGHGISCWWVRASLSGDSRDGSLLEDRELLGDVGFAVLAIKAGGDDGQDQCDRGDDQAGDGELAVVVTGGEHHSAEGGAGSVAEVEGSLVEGGGEVRGSGGLVDDAGLERGSSSELDGSPQ